MADVVLANNRDRMAQLRVPAARAQAWREGWADDDGDLGSVEESDEDGLIAGLAALMDEFEDEEDPTNGNSGACNSPRQLRIFLGILWKQSPPKIADNSCRCLLHSPNMQERLGAEGPPPLEPEAHLDVGGEALAEPPAAAEAAAVIPGEDAPRARGQSFFWGPFRFTRKRAGWEAWCPQMQPPDGLQEVLDRKFNLGRPCHAAIAALQWIDTCECDAICNSWGKLRFYLRNKNLALAHLRWIDANCECLSGAPRLRMENRMAREKRADFAEKSVNASKLSADDVGKLQKRVFTDHNRVGGHDLGGMEDNTGSRTPNTLSDVS